MNKRRDFLTGLVGASIVGTAGCLSSDNPSGEGSGGTTTVAVGGATQGSAGFETCQALQRTVSQESDSVELSTQQTDGSGEANFRLYDQGDIDAGSFDNFIAAKAANNKDSFSERPLESMPYQGFYLLITHLYMVARADTDIRSTDDLSGTNVWLNPPGTTVRPPTDVVLKNAGLWEEINKFDMDRSDLPGALEEGQVDVVVAYGVNYANPPGWVKEIDSRVDFQAVEATDEFVQAIQDGSGVPHEEVELYGWEQDLGVENIDSWTVANQFRFGSNISEEAAKEITRIAYEHNGGVREASSLFPEYSEVEDMTTAIMDDQEIHPGVANYWKENDAWNDSWSVGELD